MIKITLNKIFEHDPCTDGWEKILEAHGKSEPDDVEFNLVDALETNGLYDTLWSLRCLPELNSLWRKYAVWCARQVEHLMEDQRSKDALEVAQRHSEELATDEELDAAWDAARDAARDAAWAAARSAAGSAARSAAGSAARSAARDAAGSAARAAARDAAGSAARAAAGAAAWAAQQEKLKQILTSGHWVD